MIDKLKTAWANVKAWFAYSTTILLARAQAFAGVLVAALTAIDWSPLYSAGFGSNATGLDNRQLYVIGGFLVFNGILTEIARRRTL